MSFLNAIFLLALPVAATPVVLHLLRRRQRQVVSWGAMQFLTDAVGEGRRFDRLEEWLLLAARVLAILALIFALARPRVSNFFGSSAGVSNELVLVVDDSLSTSLGSSSGQAFDRIKAAAQQRIDDAPADTWVSVLLASEGPRWLMDQGAMGGTAARERMSGAVEKLSPNRGAANFLGCLRLAASFDSGNENVERRVAVITDRQAHGWRVDARSVWTRLRRAVENGPRRVVFSVEQIDTAPLSGPNLSIDRVTASRAITGPGESILFTAEVTNTGRVSAPPTNVEWSVDGKRSAALDLPRLAPGQTRSVEWRGQFDSLGVHDVTAVAQLNDSLPLDDSAGTVIEVIRAAPILVLTQEANRDHSENMFLKASLGYDRVEEADGQRPWKSLFKPKLVNYADAEQERFEDYHAVVLNSLRELPPPIIDRLETFVRDGGGLWVMLGTRLDRDEFNRRWYRDGAGICPIPLASLMRPEGRESAEATIHPPSGDHPATAMLADTERLDIDRVRLRRYHTFRRVPGQDLTVLLESGRGAPLALSHFMGKGRTIVQAFPLTADWSDLAISKSFVVMMQDWLSYLSEGSSTRYNLTPHETFVYALRSDIDPSDAEVRLPSKEKLTTEPVGRDGVVAYRFSSTGLPGRYELKLSGVGGAGPKIPFRIQRDPAESDLTRLTKDDTRMLSGAAGIYFNGAPPPPSKAEQHAALGQQSPAWWPLLFAMVCLMVGESLLATRVSRGRFGVMRDH